jgi:putative nucleotidyltransferase with HDIG domain
LLANISIPILAKITVPYVFLAGLIAVGGTFLVTRVVFDSVEERFTNQLIEAALLASESMVGLEQDLLEDVRVISFLGGMAEAVEARNSGAVLELGLPAAYGTTIESFAILDRRGQALVALRFDEVAQIYDEMNFVDGPRGADFVASVLAGQRDESGDKFVGFLEAESGQFLFVAGPIRNEDGSLVGVAMVGQSVEDLATEIRLETLAQLSFYTLEGETLVSTFQGDQALDPSQSALILDQQDQGSLARELEDSSINYRELLSAWEVRGGQDIGVVGVALPTSFITNATDTTRTNTLLLMGVAMLLVVLIGVVVAGRITQPIHALRDAALRVAAGNLQVKVPPSSRDELGVLTMSFNEMVDNLNQSKQDQLDTYNDTIEGWSRALDLRDHETEGHSQRVTAMAVELAQQMGMAGDELEHLRRGALLHDIGKIAIPDGVLLKPGPLSAAEREMINRHPDYAKNLLEQVDFLEPALAIPYSHHEHWDGKGYPQGLKGEEIPLAARVFAVVDVWDALTSDRPYRKAMSHEEAIAIIWNNKGTHFDPEVVDEFLQLVSTHMPEESFGKVD